MSHFGIGPTPPGAQHRLRALIDQASTTSPATRPSTGSALLPRDRIGSGSPQEREAVRQLLEMLERMMAGQGWLRPRWRPFPPPPKPPFTPPDMQPMYGVVVDPDPDPFPGPDIQPMYGVVVGPDPDPFPGPDIQPMYGVVVNPEPPTIQPMYGVSIQPPVAQPMYGVSIPEGPFDPSSSGGQIV